MLLYILLQTAADWHNIVGIADSLTVTSLLILAVLAFTRGWVITPARLNDWEVRETQERERGDRLEAALRDTTTRLDSNTQALMLLKDILSHQISK